MNHLSRPALGIRAISDLAPLSSPKPDSAKNEIGVGTRATHAGVRVVSGKAVALGGIAPFSPFLPMPPAQSKIGLLRQFERRSISAENETDGVDDVDDDIDNNNNDEDVSAYSFPVNMVDLSQRRASSDDIPTHAPMPAAVTMKRSPTKPAPFMIRSYSMPVATQSDFEAQQRAERVRRSQHRALHESWSMSRTNSQASTEAETSRQPLRTLNTNEISSSLARTMSRQASTTSHDHQAFAPNWDANTTDSYSNASSSDETDVRTPRATSPASADVNQVSKQATVAETTFFIHPDHMQKPPSWNDS